MERYMLKFMHVGIKIEKLNREKKFGMQAASCTAVYCLGKSLDLPRLA